MSDQPRSAAMKAFISYSHADSAWLDRLHKHLAQLKREGSIDTWYDREISAGGKLDLEIRHQLREADIFIAALSPDFIASDYCNDVELHQALQLEESGSLIIVPIVFEPCDWLSTPLSKFKALPDDGKPVAEFANHNVALLTVTSEIRRLIAGSSVKVPRLITSSSINDLKPSRYRIKKDFDGVDRRDFINRSFNEIKSFFRLSASEINAIPEIDAEFRENDQDSFSCSIVNRGLGRAFETVTIRRRGTFGDIDTVYGERPRENTSNGGFSVQSDEYEMYFAGMSFHYGHQEETKMTALDVAKVVWDDLLRKIGVDYA